MVCPVCIATALAANAPAIAAAVGGIGGLVACKAAMGQPRERTFQAAAPQPKREDVMPVKPKRGVDIASRSRLPMPGAAMRSWDDY